MNIMQILKCAYYGCEETSSESFACCSKEHGWLHKTNQSQLVKYQDGIGSLKELGLAQMSIGEILYYNSLI